MSHLSRLAAPALCLLLALPACGGEDSGPRPGPDAAAGETAGDVGPAETAPPEPLLVEGDYLLAVELAGLDLVLPFKVHAGATAKAGGGGTITLFQLRSMSMDKSWTSDVLAEAKDVPVAADGSFTLSLGQVVMPAKSTPTHSDVELKDLAFAGKILSTKSFCGTVTGTLPMLKLDLVGSTFKAVPFGEEKEPLEASCEAGQAEHWAPIAKCPALVAGDNKIESAELQRSFTLFLPAGATPTDGWPLVFLFHGLGNSVSGIVKDTGFDKLAAEKGFILAVPAGADDAKGARRFPTEWRYHLPLYADDNRDLVFFDDMLKCIAAGAVVDGKRVYVTGMSAGGLFATFVAANRSKVLAAAAVFSGGYMHPWPSGAEKIPLLVTWGGPTDKAVSTDFHTLAIDLLAKLAAAGWYVVKCEHTLGHEWPPEGTAATWAFLSAASMGQASHPFGSTLPAGFPSYCQVAK